jgi:hypothetical protein
VGYNPHVAPPARGPIAPQSLNMNHYTFTIWQTSDGLDHAKWGDLTVNSRSGATRALARKLVGLDALEDLPIQVRDRGGKLRFTARSLHSHAAMKIVEGPDVRIHLGRHVPFPATRVR